MRTVEMTSIDNKEIATASEVQSDVQISMPHTKVQDDLVKQHHFLRKLQYYGTICQSSYLDKNEIDQRKYELLDCYTNPVFFNLGKTQVFSFIVREVIDTKVCDQLLICYRGTDQFKDWYSNFDTRKVPLLIKGKQYGKVHKGFYQYVQPAQEFIEDQITEFLGQNQQDIIYEQSVLNAKYLKQKSIALNGVEKSIIFCGHSLGGSCVIPALQVSLMDKVYCPIKVITFGSPRIGDKEFTKWVDKQLPINVRVINQSDIVPNLPSRVFFKHTPYLIHMKHNEYKVLRDGDNIEWFYVLKFVKDLYLNLQMHGIVYIFKRVLSRAKMVENHFMDNYISALKKYDL